jgi:hypothetical protein
MSPPYDQSSSSGFRQSMSASERESTSRGGTGGGANKSRSYYHQQFKSYEMRFSILKNEMDELLLEQDAIKNRKQKIQFGKNNN